MNEYTTTHCLESPAMSVVFVFIVSNDHTVNSKLKDKIFSYFDIFLALKEKELSD